MRRSHPPEVMTGTPNAVCMNDQPRSWPASVFGAEPGLDVVPHRARGKSKATLFSSHESVSHAVGFRSTPAPLVAPRISVALRDGERADQVTLCLNSVLGRSLNCVRLRTQTLGAGTFERAIIPAVLLSSGIPRAQQWTSPSLATRPTLADLSVALGLHRP